MNKPKFETQDITQENINKIGKLFPNCITEAKDENGNLKKVINFEVLKQILTPEALEGDESYEFTWVGKKAAIVEANKPIRKTLRPCKEESVNWDTTENLYIEGDNLEVLKLLQESYLGKVKMIYIDPPYNTGNDFIYRDDFSTDSEEYDEESGLFDEKGNRLFKNTDTNGRFHSDWCSMIYSRLLLARNLLSEDGVIFISIDDNEIDNLKKISDEIFGESNFKTVFSRVTKKGGKSSSEVAKNHDFLLMYVKNQELADLKGIAHTDEGYCKKDEYFEKRGYYKANQTLDYDSLGYVKSLDYPIEIDGEIFYAGGKTEDYVNRQKGQHGRADWGWRWRWSKELFEFGLKNGFIEIHKGGERNRIYTKTYEKVTIDRSDGEYKIVEFDRTKPLSTLEFTENEYSNDNAKKVFDSLMGKGIFEYTKTPEMIKTLQSLVATKDFIVLDFFSGSATTAHAVLQLNAEDGGNRKFIMVQLPEQTDETSEAYKAGYKNICEIGKERIRKVGRVITEENPDKCSKLDIGFRVLKLDDTNMKDVYYSASEYEQNNLELFESNIKEDRNDLDLLFGCLLEWGLPLSLPYTSETIGKFTVHTYNDGDLVACFNEDVSEEVVKEIAHKKPLRAVFRDSSFSNSASKINVFEIFKMISPETSVKVI